MAHNGAVPLRAQARGGLACECKKEGYGYVTKNVTRGFLSMRQLNHTGKIGVYDIKPPQEDCDKQTAAAGMEYAT